MAKKILIFSGLAVAFILAVTMVAWFSLLNHTQIDGTIRLQGPRERITIDRDEKGMAYVHARSVEEALFGQGFAGAQDRLFQMELNRRAAAGRLAEVLGPERLPTDVYTRTLGFHRQAERHAEMLDDRNRAMFQAYVDGINAYIERRTSEHPLEFTLAGFKPERWTIADSLAIVYLMGWQSAANASQEVIAQSLVDTVGPDRALEIFPVNINPDDLLPMAADGATTATLPTDAATTEGLETEVPATGSDEELLDESPDASSEEFLDEETLARGLNLLGDERLMAMLDHAAPNLELGSNNWVVSGPRSPNLAPVVSNDPHLSANMLPGPLYPMGLRGPGFRVVGAGVAGIPGMVIGRSEHIAIGATNAYGDTQDLYIETIDPANPGHYLQGAESIPFDVVTETIRVKDKRGVREEELKIRSTVRGPVVSGVLPGLGADRVVTLRYSAFETMGPDLGLDLIFTARNVEDIRARLANVTTIALNFVFADTRGGYGLQTTGRVPVRSAGDGLLPFAVSDGADNWTGFIPFDEMPAKANDPRGWIGTANHKTTGPDYPYDYSTYFSPYYRYARMSEVLDGGGKVSVDDNWALQRDAKNLMAERLAPIMAEALLAHEDTAQLGEILRDWDYMDLQDAVAPTVFQSVYRHFALRTFQDELGPEVAARMLGTYYFWVVRLETMVVEGNSPWFDDVTTADATETRDDLFHLAAIDTIREFAPRYLNDPRGWKWGRVHRMTFTNPLRPSGFLSGCLGGGSHAVDGSGETLYRGIYAFSDPYEVSFSAALRMVADLGDPEKVVAVMPSGVSGRTLDRHYTDQVEEYINGNKLYWWFSEGAIERHSQGTLTIEPMGN